MAGLVPKKMRSTAAVAWCFMKHRLFACSSTSSICRTLMTLPWLSHLIWAWSARRTTPSCSCRSLGTVRSSHPDGLSPGSHNWKINLQFVVTPCAHRTKTSSSSWPSNLVVLHSEGYFGGFPKNLIFVPSSVMPKVLPDITFSFSPCFLGSSLCSTFVVLPRILKLSRRSVLSSSDLTHCSTSFVARSCLTFCSAVLTARP